MKSAWLIEVDTLAAHAPRYIHEAGVLSWTSDHRAARKFETKAEADNFAAKHLNDGVRVCEHRFD